MCVRVRACVWCVDVYVSGFDRVHVGLIIIMLIFSKYPIHFKMKDHDINVCSPRTICSAAFYGNLGRLKDIQRQQSDLYDDVKTNSYALKLAVINAQLDVIKWLLQNFEVDLNYKEENNGEIIDERKSKLRNQEIVLDDNNVTDLPYVHGTVGSTMLICACWRGHYDVVKFLLENYSSKIDINLPDSFFKITPLYNACYYLHFKLAKYLCEKVDNLDVNISADTETTPLHALIGSSTTQTALIKACMEGSDLITLFEVYCLLYFDIWATLKSINEQDNLGYTALHWAFYNGNYNCVKLLLLCKPDSTIATNDGKRADELVKGKKPHDIVRFEENRWLNSIRNYHNFRFWQIQGLKLGDI